MPFALPEPILQTGLWILLLGGAGCSLLLYLLVSLPLRRQERARILVDLVEVRENPGQSLVEALVSMSRTRDPSLGVGFHLLAAHLEAGRSFGTALELVPRLLPVGIRRVLAAGEELGDCRRVVPLCRQMLEDAAGTVRMMANHILLLLLVSLPMIVVSVAILGFYIPRIRELGMEFGRTLPPMLDAALSLLPPVLILLCGLVLLLYVVTLFHYGGPRLRQWMEFGFSPLLDRCFLWIPWQRTRIHRDFSLMLGWLLDQGVSETRALEQAAACTANSAFVRRVESCRTALASGQSLEQAILKLKGAPQLAWRLGLASRHSRGFRAALRGWWEWLHARARRQEQIAAQLLGAILVLFNAFILVIVATSTFHILTEVIEEAVLW